MERKAVAFEQLSDIFGFRLSSTGSQDCYAVLGIVHTTWPQRARPVQGLHLDAQAERLPLAAHHGGRPWPPARGAADPHRGHGSHRRVRHRGACALQGRQGRATDPALARESRAYEWLRRTVETLAEGDSPEEFLEHTKLGAVPRPGVLLHAEGQADCAAAGSRRRSISPMRSIPMSATRLSAAR